MRVVLSAVAATLLALTSSAAAATGDITLYPVPNALSTFGVATGADGNLWTTDSERGSAYRVTPSGSATEFLVGSHPGAITAGPDGALWITEGFSRSIVRLATDGTVTSFPVHRQVDDAIVTGPDGALWFGGVGQVGRITTAGATTFYQLSSTVAGVTRIVLGPDGNLWFTVEDSVNGSQIGRVTPAGAVTEFPLPGAPNRFPIGIGSGPDGALWFTEPDSNSIGRITTAGALTEIPLPSTGSEAYDIVAGPDGALWFTELLGNRIGRVTTGGAFTEYPVPAPGRAPAGIGLGPDGALWFGSRESGVLGRIAVDSALVAKPNDQVSVEKAEQFVGLGPRQTKTTAVACPSGYAVLDGSPLVQSVDQGTGTTADIQIIRSESTGTGAYIFTLRNPTTGRAQAKAFVTCVLRTTTDRGRITVSSWLASSSVPFGTGATTSALSCPSGSTAVDPGYRFISGVGRVTRSAPTATLGGWTFTIAGTAAGSVALSIRCLSTATSDGDLLRNTELSRTVAVPGRQTVTAQVTCPEGSKGVVASYNLPTGVVLLGDEPQSTTRVFTLQNATGTAQTVTLDLLCLSNTTSRT